MTDDFHELSVNLAFSGFGNLVRQVGGLWHFLMLRPDQLRSIRAHMLKNQW